MNRTIVYIDGFNLYYGALRGSPFKWLNLERYFQLLRPTDDIRRIYYYSAMIHGSRQADQRTYLRALETLPLVEIVLGRFKGKQVTCTVTGCTYAGRRIIETVEEKRTDVNIALGMLNDAHQDRCDRFVLVSGDSDLVPAVHMVKSLFPEKEVLVYVPARNAIRGAAVELRTAADKSKTLPLALLRHAQFPSIVRTGSGATIAKPPDW